MKTTLAALTLVLAGCAYPTYVLRTDDVKTTITSGLRGFPLGSITIRNNSFRSVLCEAYLNRPVQVVLAPLTSVSPGAAFSVEVRKYFRVGATYSITVGCVAAGGWVRSATRVWSFSDWGYSLYHQVWYVEEANGTLFLR